MFTGIGTLANVAAILAGGLIGLCFKGGLKIEESYIVGDYNFNYYKANEEFEKLSISPEVPLCLVAQTTFNYNKFQELVEIICKKGYDIYCINSICNAT